MDYGKLLLCKSNGYNSRYSMIGSNLLVTASHSDTISTIQESLTWYT